MLQYDNYLKVIFFLYLTISIGLYYFKPSMMFSDGQIKQFGVGKNKTIFYFPLALIIIAIIIYISIYTLFLKNI